jgi:hypothetical protein
MTLRNMVILFLATTKVFLHLLDNFLFVERGADMRVNPIELFRGSLTSGMARWPRASPVSFCKLNRQNLLYGESACRFALRRRHSHLIWSRAPPYSQLIWSQNADVIGPGDLCYRAATARYPYYLLADSPEGIKTEMELTGKIPPEHKTEDDIRKGFVYKRVPHVTLKSIANNPDIKEGMTRKQIDAAITRHAEMETLYDQPYEDNKRVRVCGPFSVESLSPHRVLSTADENLDGTVTEQEARKEQDFATMILDNLKKAGVQNTRKSERLNFDRLPMPACG